MVPLSIMGVWKNDQKSIVDECASQVTLFVQVLSLELAGERRFLSNGLFFFEGSSLITATVCAYKLNNAR